MVCEVMGRSAGWIGLTAGHRRERRRDPRARSIRSTSSSSPERIVQRHREHRPFSIVVVSEGAAPLPGTMDVPDYPLDPNGWPRLGRDRRPGRDRARRGEPATRAGSPCSGTCSAVGRRSRTTACSATRLGVAAVDEAVAGGWGTARGRGRGAARHDPDRRGGRAPPVSSPTNAGGSRRSSATEAAGPR